MQTDSGIWEGGTRKKKKRGKVKNSKGEVTENEKNIKKVKFVGGFRHRETKSKTRHGGGTHTETGGGARGHKESYETIHRFLKWG